jgi:glycosyltransferase involved in cell wall biosynthesis
MLKLHLIALSYADRGHTKEYVTNFCNRLHEKFDIVLYVASEISTEVPVGITVKYIDVDITKLKAENFLKYGRFANIFKNLKKKTLHISYCKQVVKQDIKKEDIVYIMDHTALSLLPLFKGLKKTNTKVFLWIHSARFDSKDIIYHIYKLAVKSIFNYYVSKSLTGIIVNGEIIKERLPQHLNFPKEKIHVIQYPSEIQYKTLEKKKARETLHIPSDENVVLFFGGLRTDKNIEEVVRTTAQSKTKPLLIIAGSESTVSRQTIEKWLKKYNHQNYFLDISYVTEENMALYYSCSDVLLLTYGSESASQSGPLSLAREFLLPAIVTDTGEIGYYIKQNNIGLTAALEIKDDFKTKLDYFFDEKNLQEHLLENLKRAKEVYSWDAAALKYIDLLLT